MQCSNRKSDYTNFGDERVLPDLVSLTLPSSNSVQAPTKNLDHLLPCSPDKRPPLRTDLTLSFIFSSYKISGTQLLFG